jgi:hypothetical protein
MRQDSSWHISLQENAQITTTQIHNKAAQIIIDAFKCLFATVH